MRYMFDTNIFNEILDRKIDLNFFRSGITCCVTHIQRDEISKCKEEERRNALNKIFEDIVEEKYLTETFITDVSRAGEARVGNSELYNKLRTELDRLNRKKKNNNYKDALIGETALINNIILVTHDMEFFRVMTELKCAVANIYQVIKVHIN